MKYAHLTGVLTAFIAAGVSFVPSALAQEAPPQNDNGFVLVDEDMEKVNERLMAAEQELLRQLKQEKSTLETDSAHSEDSVAKASLKTTATLTTASEPLASSEQGNPDLRQLQNDYLSLQDTVEKQRTAFSQLEESKASIESKLQKTQSKVSNLLQELEETRNRLIIAETEVERLSSIIEARNIHNLSSLRPAPKIQSEQKLARKTPVSSTRKEHKNANSTLIATVTVPKANLRTGPGMNNSPLMSVKKNSRLVVEKQLDGWYRVVTPEGTRAWISSSVVSFGSSASASPTRTVKIAGYNPDVESQAYELIKSHSSE